MLERWTILSWVNAMSSPSEWPLPKTGVRFVVPDAVLAQCRAHALCQSVYPLAMGFYPTAYAHEISRPVHDDHLIIYCVDGWGSVRMGESVATTGAKRVGPGDLILLPAGCAHAYQADMDNPWSIFWLHFQGNLAQLYLDNMSDAGEAGCWNIGVAPSLVAEFEQLLSCRVMAWSTQVAVNVCCRVQSLLSHFSLQVLRADQKYSEALDVNAVHGLMLSRVEGQIDLEALAAHFHYSRFYFTKIYKQLTGTTPIKQFIQYKMEHACYLLDSTSLPVSQVANRLGYEDAYYFSRLFKKTVGVSPRVYRSKGRV